MEERELGNVYGSRVAFRLEENQSPEPDIAFVRTDRLHVVSRDFVEGAPDLAIEIVSPESIERDYVHKREQYRQAGVPEYWIVDEMEQRMVMLKRSASGAYREAKPRKGVLHSQALAGLLAAAGMVVATSAAKEDNGAGGNPQDLKTRESRRWLHPNRKTSRRALNFTAVMKSIPKAAWI